MKIPLSSPDITEAEIETVVAVLRSSRLSLGPVTEQFEQQTAAYVSLPHAIAVSSGTAGLHLCIRGLGIGEGDEVIVPSFTFIAAANAIRYEGATPVFVDIEPVTLNMDPQRIEDAITPRTKAILAVHTFGIPAEMSSILEIARRHDLLVIEDACEALGAESLGRKIGSIGIAGVFAFYPNKQITTGEGGMVVTEDDKLAARIRALRNHGRYQSDDWFQHSELGFNFRISEINCALGLAQMRRIEEILKKREAVAFACRVRLRPILMTSLATIFGLIPMALKLGTGSEAYAPLARAIIGGLSVSVVLTLFIVPAAMLVAYRGRDDRRPKTGLPAQAIAEPEPAS